MTFVLLPPHRPLPISLVGCAEVAVSGRRQRHRTSVRSPLPCPAPPTEVLQTVAMCRSTLLTADHPHSLQCQQLRRTSSSHPISPTVRSTPTYSGASTARPRVEREHRPSVTTFVSSPVHQQPPSPLPNPPNDISRFAVHVTCGFRHTGDDDLDGPDEQWFTLNCIHAVDRIARPHARPALPALFEGSSAVTSTHRLRDRPFRQLPMDSGLREPIRRLYQLYRLASSLVPPFLHSFVQ
ncbi:hypothetical protein GALMADRAFT_240759 [Galerina marginata CBS 339.88]|uniref:Uncharacterized protein n=1 Tax=Galerina marginata (strain CBS 339.88) TaxID=685588 RepID=A0A067TIS5_GALM3|nr:hypothetical protein GALMADRAFT_240759 [Galerina marginata CBS 339.88]